jgi:hypothetical protein
MFLGFVQKEGKNGRTGKGLPARGGQIWSWFQGLVKGLIDWLICQNWFLARQQIKGANCGCGVKGSVKNE